MPRDSAAADRPASYLAGPAAAFPLFFPDRTKPINQLPFSPSAKFPKSGSSCESRANARSAVQRSTMPVGICIGGDPFFIAGKNSRREIRKAAETLNFRTAGRELFLTG